MLSRICRYNFIRRYNYNYNQTRMVLGCLLTVLLLDENHHHSLICEVQIIIIAMQSVTDAQLLAGRTNSNKITRKLTAD